MRYLGCGIDRLLCDQPRARGKEQDQQRRSTDDTGKGQRERSPLWLMVAQCGRTSQTALILHGKECIQGI